MRYFAGIEDFYGISVRYGDYPPSSCAFSAKTAENAAISAIMRRYRRAASLKKTGHSRFPILKFYVRIIANFAVILNTSSQFFIISLRTAVEGCVKILTVLATVDECCQFHSTTTTTNYNSKLPEHLNAAKPPIGCPEWIRTTSKGIKNPYAAITSPDNRFDKPCLMAFGCQKICDFTSLIFI